MSLEYILEEDNSKRYPKNINKTDTLEHDKYIFGCEFEFYINDGKKFDLLLRELYDISEVDLLVNELSIPRTDDADSCMHLKCDDTLETDGWEISTPKCPYSQLKIYIEKINNLIANYAYTNNDTGFHLHISTIDKNGINLDFFKFALLSDNQNLLNSWYTRNQHCKNVMDVINYHDKKDSRDIKTKKGRIWNLEKVDSHRMEIRTMGGDSYHLQNDKIFGELDSYIDIFEKTLSQDSDEYISLKMQHLEKINEADNDIKIEFSKLFLQNL